MGKKGGKKKNASNFSLCLSHLKSKNSRKPSVSSMLEISNPLSNPLVSTPWTPKSLKVWSPKPQLQSTSPFSSTCWLTSSPVLIQKTLSSPLSNFSTQKARAPSRRNTLVKSSPPEPTDSTKKNSPLLWMLLQSMPMATSTTRVWHISSPTVSKAKKKLPRNKSLSVCLNCTGV